MKLITAIVHDRDSRCITQALLREGFSFTKMGSTGGFLREGNTTLLMGVEAHELERALRVFAENSQSREQVTNALPSEMPSSSTVPPVLVSEVVGGAVVFVMEVERFARF
jgi:uncharacterized protein YaaQ